MSGIINWLKQNRVYIVTLTLYGDPDYHMDIFKERDPVKEAKLAPFQQWVFSDGESAKIASQGICEAVIKKGSEVGKTIDLVVKEEVIENSSDVVLCVELKCDGDTQYRLYVTAFSNKSGEWI